MVLKKVLKEINSDVAYQHVIFTAFPRLYAITECKLQDYFLVMAIIITSLFYDNTLSTIDAESAADHNPRNMLIPSFNIAAAGDWDCNSNTEETVRNILSKDPELTIGLGDYVYNEKSADCWIGKIEPLKEIIKIVVGNHETESPTILNQIIDYLGIDYFGENKQQYYYSFDFHNVHFIVMTDYEQHSSDEMPHIYQKGSEQYNFVKNDLAKSVVNPEIEWTIVSRHAHEYASTEGETIPAVGNWSKIYHPLFGEHNVDLVLQGHEHNYQRTYPLEYNNGNPDKPTVTDINRNNYSDPTGQIFVTVGTAGAQLRSLDGSTPYTVTQHDGFGFLNIDITNRGKTLNATFVANDGSIKDQFIITK